MILPAVAENHQWGFTIFSGFVNFYEALKKNLSLGKKSVTALTRILSHAYFRILNTLEVTGWREFPAGTLFYANHRTLADPFLLFLLLGKRHRFWIPGTEYYFKGALRRKIAEIWRVILLEEGNRQQNAASLEKLVEIVQKGESVVIFPEGSRRLVLGTFKPGLARIATCRKGLLIVPVSLEIFPGSFFKKNKVSFGNAISSDVLPGLSKKKILEHLRAELVQLSAV